MVMRNPVQALFFSWTCLLTKYFPRTGARLLDLPIRSIVGSRLVSAFFSRRNRSHLIKVRSFRRFLVHPDVHIGDAIMAQSAATALRDFFPDAEVDVVANRSVMTLIEGNPEVTRFLPMYSGGTFPPDSELEAVAQLMKQGKYDLCINMNPFLTSKRFEIKNLPIFDFTSHASTIIRNESTVSQINHIAFQYHRFIHDLLKNRVQPLNARPFVGVPVRLSDGAVEEAARFLEGFGSDRALVMFNTDTASPYTRLPFAHQTELVRLLLQQGVSLLIGAGHTEAGLGKRLIETVSPPWRNHVRLIPANMSLAGFSALGDQADLFITGDTGPMHIAAARKVSPSGNYRVRNQTALLCLFGATPSRMSGYDSVQPGYLPSNQDSPSWTVVAGSPCRNITCLNKLFKTCQTVRCFEEIEMSRVANLVAGHLKKSSDVRRLASLKIGR